MTVVKVEDVVKAEENPALVGENPGLDDEAETGYISPEDEYGDDEDGETDSDGDYEIPSGGPQLKKGPWTPEEDRRLKNYVEAHGEGNWNKVQRNAGLNRCGKSCRLRWANHLRPDLKKGPFDAEEVEKIIRFHIMWGNKWAKMASHLPGRTDNEIKNYWNTRLKRNQRHGLPVYPEYMLSRVTHPHHDTNFETPVESHGKKRLNEYSKDKVVEMHDLIGSAIVSGHPAEPPSIQVSSSYNLSNDWLHQCPSTSIEQQSPASISSHTTSLLGANIHNTDILDGSTNSGRSFEIPIPMVCPMMHSSSVFGNPEHEGCLITKIQSSNLSSGSEDVFNIGQCYPVASFSDRGIPVAPPEASFLNDTPSEASFLNDTPPEASFLNDTPPEDAPLEASLLEYLKDQSLYLQEPKPLTDGGQWFDPCHKPDFPGP